MITISYNLTKKHETRRVYDFIIQKIKKYYFIISCKKEI
jgi:hypothetical protein